MDRYTITAGLLWLAAAVACGSVSQLPDGGGDGDFTLSVAPAALEVPIASARTATLVVSRAGATGDIALTARDVPAGVDVTFAPSTLSAADATSQVTITVAAGTPAGTSSITLVGAAGDVQRTATLDVTAATITVAGRIHGGRSGIAVRIAGKPPTTSDGAGNFVFTDVAPPYDIYTTGTDQVPGRAPSPAVVYYAGLTRPDPEIAAPEIISATGTTLSYATVTGTKTGGDEISARVIAWSNGGLLRGTGSTYSVAVSWPQAPTNVGTLYGLQWSKRANGAPATFLGYGAVTDTLADGATRNLNLSLTAPASAEVSGTITPPPGFPAPSVRLQQQLGNISEQLWASVTSSVATSIPLVDAGTSTIFAVTSVRTGDDTASSAWVYPGLTAATDVSVAMPAPPALSTPVAGASNVTVATPFRFESAPSAVHVVTIVTTGEVPARYVVYTADTTLSIPDVPELPLPLDQAFTWQVRGHGPFAGVDEAATAVGIRDALPYEFEPGTPHFSTTSPTWAFTSAP